MTLSGLDLRVYTKTAFKVSLPSPFLLIYPNLSLVKWTVRLLAFDLFVLLQRCRSILDAIAQKLIMYKGMENKNPEWAFQI